MASEFTATRRIAFSETDSAGIVHFANYPKFAEDVEHAFFRSVGLSIATELADGTRVGWPRVRSSWNYLSPLRFEEECELRLVVRKLGDKSITYAIEIRRLGGDQPTLCARGTTVAVCVQGVEGGRMRSVPIPALVRDRIEQAPAERLKDWPED
jgi:acyl-CoA thioester hydrolase